MRTFIAVELPEDIRNAVGYYIDSLKGLIKNVKWISRNNLHLTIKFLGDVKESDLENINDCVSKTASIFNPFVMGLSHIGFFPSRRKPRVVWISADGGEDNLIDIFHDLENYLEHLGFDRDSRTFSPHLTIGRVKRYEIATVPEILPEFDPVTFDVNSIALIKSTLTPRGPIYEKLFEGEMKQISK